MSRLHSRADSASAQAASTNVEPGLGSRGQDVDGLAIAAQPSLSVSKYSGRIISASQ
jgi:hypothetical protein